MKHTVDARGLACPLPVVNTKNKIQTMSQGETVEVLVDNDIAVQNLTKFAKVRNHSIQAEKQAENLYRVLITVGQEAPKMGSQNPTEDEVCQPDARNNTVVVLSSNQMGSGEEALGKTLMKAFLFALTKQDTYPSAILLYNSGAYLSCQDSDSLEDLKQLEAEGVKISTCGTCLNFYGLTDKLAVGGITNMYDIVETMNNAGKIIKP